MDMSAYFSKKDRLDDLVEKHLKRVRLTYEAFEKMNIYHKIVRDTIGQSYECAGFLLNSKDSQDGVCRDVMLVKGQHVTPAHVDFDSGAIHSAYAEAKERKMKVIGPWHSHGSLSYMEHSSFDVGHLRAIYIENRLNLPNYLPFGRNHSDFSKGTLDVHYDGKNITLACKTEGPDKIAELEYRHPSTIHMEIKGKLPALKRDILENVLSKCIESIRFSSETGITYAQSIIINDDVAMAVQSMKHGWKAMPRCSLRVIYQKEPSSDEFIEIEDRKRVKMEFVDEKNGVVLDEKALREEVYGSVFVGSRPIAEYLPRSRQRTDGAVASKEDAHERKTRSRIWF